MTTRGDSDRDVSLQGQYAGIVTRGAAFGIDVVVAASLFALGGHVFEYLFSSLLDREVTLSDARVVAVIALTLWLLGYFAYPIAVGGRTLGMALVGLEVLTKDGRHVSVSRAVLRTVCLPLSLMLLGVGVLMILIDRRHRTLHDVIAGTTVVYSWNARAARLRFLAHSTEGRPG